MIDHLNEGARIERKAIRRMIGKVTKLYIDKADTDMYSKGAVDALAQLKAMITIQVQLASKRSGGLGSK